LNRLQVRIEFNISFLLQVSNSQPSQIIYEKEANIIINYSGLDEELKVLDDMEDVRKVEKSLEKQINELQSTINRIQVRLEIWKEALFQVTSAHVRNNWGGGVFQIEI
jgi:hypothetical protein